MLSDKKLQANRENAQLSTGPRTESGIQISSMNRTSHGLTARTVVLKNEDQAEFNDLHAKLMADYEPQSAIETELVNEIAAGAWRLRRADRLETECFDDGRFDDLDKIRRYRTSIERAFHKAIEQLRKIQSQPKYKEALKENALREAYDALMKSFVGGFDSQTRDSDPEEDDDEPEVEPGIVEASFGGAPETALPEAS